MIDAHAIAEEQIIDIQIQCYDRSGSLRRQVVVRETHTIHHPQDATALHKVLVQDILIALAKRLLWISYDYCLIGIQHARFITQHSSIHLVVLSQCLRDVIHISLVQFAMSLQKSHFLHFLLGQTAYCFHEGILQVLYAIIEVLFSAQSSLILEQRHHLRACAIFDKCIWINRSLCRLPFVRTLMDNGRF